MMPVSRFTCGAVAATWIVALLAITSTLAAQRSDAIVLPEAPQPILPLDEVRIGMKGYGLTVFHGTKIEAFPVEVVSVMRDHTPKRGVIWIHCPDERMQRSGPVQGMSGSPIYLWREGEEQIPGQGGLLIGAFAYGYAAQLDSYAGVQPIELMREAADRAVQKEEREEIIAGRAQRSGPTMHEWIAMLDAMPGASHDGWRARAMAKLLVDEAAEPRAASPMAAPLRMEGQAQRLMLPVQVSSPQIAALTGPLFERLGLSPLAGQAGMLVGKPPAEIQAANVRIEPGSVLSIPLGFGDADLSAAGTVTEVLPDGRVLALGHAMFSEGDSALPMATGFVHYVVANRQISFKLSGSLALQGGIVRDENSAVIGTADGRFDAAPMQVRVDMPGQPQRSYDYQVVQHRALTPIITAVLLMQSVEAVQGMPSQNTMRMVADFTFTGQRPLSQNTIMPQGSSRGMLFAILPLLTAAVDNPFELLALEKVDIRMEIEDVRRDARLVHARISRTQVAPGEAVDVVVEMQPFGQAVHTLRTRFDIPLDLPEGQYELMVSDPASHMQMLMASRPHLAQVRNVDELFERLQFILDVPDDALFVSLLLPSEGVAIGATELPRLPSSRRTMLGSSQRTGVSLYQDMVVRQVDSPYVPTGRVAFPIVVKNK